MIEIMLTNSWLVAITIAFIASFMQSLTGFGLSIIATPLLLILYDPKQVVLILQIICLVVNTLFGIFLRKHVDGKFLFFLTIGSLFGQPIGILVYHYVPNSILKISISLLILLFLLILRIHHQPIQETSFRTGLVGFLSGLLNTATSISGPPLILYLACANRDKTSMRATSIVYFGLTNLVALIGFMLSNQDLSFAANQTLTMLPAALVGLAAGNMLFPYLSQNTFGKIVFTMLLFSSAYTIYSVLRTALTPS